MNVLHKKYLKYQEKLGKTHRYRKLKKELSDYVRQEYRHTLPDGFHVKGSWNTALLTHQGTLIASGYKRIVIGDYGAFAEFDKNQIVRENIKVKEGQEYRINDPQYSKNVKYYWLTAKDDTDVKIYYQKKGVDYADYQPEMFYVSPFEVVLEPEGK